jgi:hypothetical protein
MSVPMSLATPQPSSALRSLTFARLVMRWRTGSGALAGALQGGGTGRAGARGDLILEVRPLKDDLVSLACSFTSHETRVAVPAPAVAMCSIERTGAWLHLDVRDNGLDIASITFDEEGRALYSRSRLPALAGLAGGTYEPAEVRLEPLRQAP